MSAEPLFHASAMLHIPLGLDEDGLRDALEDIANEMMVDLRIGESSSTSAG